MSYINYQKIDRKKARQLYNQGQQIYFHPSRLSWNNVWQSPLPVQKDFEDEASRKKHYQWLTDNNLHELKDGKPVPYIEQFDLHIANYSYYNCCEERGKRVIFLIEVKK